MKHIFTLLLIVLLSCNLTFAQVFSSEGISYKKTSNTTCMVTGTSLQRVIIPPTVLYNTDTLLVTEFSGTNSNDGAFRGKNLKSLYIPYTITRLNYQSFYQCSIDTLYYNAKNPGISIYTGTGILKSGCNPKIIFIEDSVKYISNNLLGNSNGLRELIIEEGITNISISNDCFVGCTSLRSVKYYAKNANISLPNNSSGLFNNCSNLTSFVFGENVKTIPSGLLKNCTNITEILLPNSVENIESEAFRGCIGLSDLTLSTNLKNIGNYAFAGCNGLSNIILPESVETIGNSAFYLCSNLYSLYIGANVQSIGNAAFGGCYLLHNITYHASDVDYGYNYSIFSGDTNITNITLGNNVRTLPKYIFSNLKKIRSIDLPEGLQRIGSNAFYNTRINEIIIPSTVTHIGQEAFKSNNNLQKVVLLPTNPPAIYENTFSGGSSSRLYIVPCGAKETYNIAPWWNSFSNTKETCQRDTVEVTICSNDFYQFGDNQIQEAGQYTNTTHVNEYLDSTTVLILHVKSSFDTTIHATICEGSYYQQYGFNDSTNGIHTQELHTSSGCDSIVRLNLTVASHKTTLLNATICEGKRYNRNGFNKRAAGEYQLHLTSAAGCDSTVTLKLKVNPRYQSTLEATIASNEQYQFNNKTLTNSGIYRDTLPTINGCDSILSLNLTVIPSIDTLIIHDTTIVFDTITIRDTITIYIDTLLISDTISSCNTKYTLILTDVSTSNNISEYGFDVSHSGDYYDTLQSIEGCDSIVHLRILNSLDVTPIISDDNIRIYPNPAQQMVTISFPPTNKTSMFYISDNTGRILFQQDINLSTGTYTFNISTFQKGIYFVKINNNIQKLIIN